MKGSYRTHLQQQALIRQASSQAINLCLSALSEVSRSDYANFVQAVTIVTSIEDEILRIDSTSAEIVEVSELPGGTSGEPSYSAGTIATRATPGKLQKIRALRAALLGTPSSPGGALSDLESLLSSQEV